MQNIFPVIAVFIGIVLFAIPIRVWKKLWAMFEDFDKTMSR
jgi:hypothetical protein